MPYDCKRCNFWGILDFIFLNKNYDFLLKYINEIEISKCFGIHIIHLKRKCISKLFSNRNFITYIFLLKFVLPFHLPTPEFYSNANIFMFERLFKSPGYTSQKEKYVYIFKFSTPTPTKRPCLGHGFWVVTFPLDWFIALVITTTQQIQITQRYNKFYIY